MSNIYTPEPPDQGGQGDIGGIDSWTFLHPERQMTLGECETELSRYPTIEDLRHNSTF